MHLLEPIDDDIRIAHEMLISGNAYEADRRVSSFLADLASSSFASDATRLAAHFLLVRIALRRLDVSTARHYLTRAREQLSDNVNSAQRLFQIGRAHWLAGEIAHTEYVMGNGRANIAKLQYEQARDSYQFEMIPVSRFEIERKLACVAAHSNKEHARSRLQNLRLKTQAPLHLPTYHRIALSLAKLAVLSNSASAEDIDRCWEAARFYSNSAVRDRYWYVESLITACCVSVSCGAPDPLRCRRRSALLPAAVELSPRLRWRQVRAQQLASGKASVAMGSVLYVSVRYW